MRQRSPAPDIAACILILFACSMIFPLLRALFATSRGGSAAALHGVVRAPMMGVMVDVRVAEGDRVDAGARLGTMESMKMEMAITAPVAGRVAQVGCAAQAKVERHQELFRVEASH